MTYSRAIRLIRIDMSSDSDEQLVRYLLGDVPEADADRLDERSITDDAFALRLRVIENDLVDRYARGEPFDASLERFERLYRASSHLRDKVTIRAGIARAHHEVRSWPQTRTHHPHSQPVPMVEPGSRRRNSAGPGRIPRNGQYATARRVWAARGASSGTSNARTHNFSRSGREHPRQRHRSSRP